MSPSSVGKSQQRRAAWPHFLPSFFPRFVCVSMPHYLFFLFSMPGSAAWPGQDAKRRRPPSSSTSGARVYQGSIMAEKGQGGEVTQGLDGNPAFSSVDIDLRRDQILVIRQLVYKLKRRILCEWSAITCNCTRTIQGCISGKSGHPH